jgi:hypothetical protein
MSAAVEKCTRWRNNKSGRIAHVLHAYGGRVYYHYAWLSALPNGGRGLMVPRVNATSATEESFLARFTQIVKES